MTQLEMLRHHRRAIESTPAKTDRDRLDKTAALVAIDKMIKIAETKLCEIS